MNELEKKFKEQTIQIEKMKEKTNTYKREMDTLFIQRQMKTDLKLDHIKNGMIKRIQQTQSEIKNINIENLNITTKLITYQNQQLLIDIKFQNDQILDLMRKMEILKKENYELKNDIEIHKIVELKIAEKNKKLSDMNKISLKKRQNEEYDELENDRSINLNSPRRKNSPRNAPRNADKHKNNNHGSYISNGNGLGDSVNMNNSYANSNESKNHININQNLKEFRLINNFEVKIRKLENELHKKHTDFTHLKNNFDKLQEKLFSHEMKYTGVFHIFEEGLKRLLKDETVQKDEDLVLNLEALQKGNYESLDNQQKYSLLIVLIKHILPLVNATDLQLQEYIKTNYDDVKFKFYMPQKNIMSDPIYRRITKNNKSGISAFNNNKNASFDASLPIISVFNDTKILKNKRINLIKNQ